MARFIIVSRGAPGSGKSTWFNQSGLAPYVVSADALRLLHSAPVLNDQGELSINQKRDADVWDMLWSIVKGKMSEGETVAIDACFSKESDFAPIHRLAETFRYRIIVVDFTDVPLDTILKQNANRGYNRVPEEAIIKVHSRFRNQHPPKYCTVLKPHQVLPYLKAKIFNYVEYNTVHIFGDIHGCNKTLQEYFKSNPVSNKDYYIFLGDLNDRGKDNVEVLRFVTGLVENGNAIVLASNHGRHLNLWAMEGNDDIIAGNQFLHNTLAEFERKGYTRQEARRLVRKEGQYALFSRAGKIYFCNHGGIPKISLQNLNFLNLREFEKGVLQRHEIDELSEIWAKNMPETWYQVHGHRSKEGMDVLKNRVFRLEGEVEFGGVLRVLQLDATGGHNIVEVKSVEKTISTRENRGGEKIHSQSVVSNMTDVGKLVAILREKKDIRERKMGDISSFNFAKEVFYSKNWNESNIMARGFFIKPDIEYPYIVARSYSKFFNIGERPETEERNILETVKYPVKCFLKENGFLGIIGLDNEKDELVFCSKSTISTADKSDFAVMFRNLFLKNHGDKIDSIKEFIRKENRSLVFEVIDVENDPHIIKYENSHVVLLDAFKRTIEDDVLDYAELCKLGSLIGCKTKELVVDIQGRDQLAYNIKALQSNLVEGYVFTDSKGFSFKLKTSYYNQWKKLRGIKDGMAKGHPVNLAKLFTPVENTFYGFMKNKLGGLSLDERNAYTDVSIIKLRDEFLSMEQ